MTQSIKVFFLALALVITSKAVTAQSRWKAYDSIYFENLFLPNFSNLLMPKGYVEAIVTNSLLNANHGWSSNTGSKFDLNGRYTFDYLTTIVNVGVSPNMRFNVGLEIHYAMGYQDSDPHSSPLSIFKSDPPGYVRQANALTSFGPRIKWRPIKRNPHFVHTTTLQFPLVHSTAVESVLGQQQLQWGNQFLYSFSAGKKLAFFAQDDFYIYFGEGTSAHNQYYNAITLYSYFLITQHFFPFLSAGYSSAYTTDVNQFRTLFQSVPMGAGLQFQFSLRFNVNLYYSQYAWAKNYNDWKTFNIGLRGVF